MKRTPLIQLIVALLILVVSIGLVSVSTLMVQKTTVKATELSAEIEAKRAEATRVEQASKALPALLSAEESIKTYFVRPDDIVPFLGQLEKQGGAQGAVVQVLSVDSNASGADKRISLSLKITGTYDAVLRTIGTIEYGPYDIVLTNVTFDTLRAPDGKTSGEWTAAAVFSLGTQPIEAPKK